MLIHQYLQALLYIFRHLLPGNGPQCIVRKVLQRIKLFLLVRRQDR